MESEISKGSVKRIYSNISWSAIQSDPSDLDSHVKSQRTVTNSQPGASTVTVRPEENNCIKKIHESSSNLAHSQQHLISCESSNDDGTVVKHARAECSSIYRIPYSYPPSGGIQFQSQESSSSQQFSVPWCSEVKFEDSNSSLRETRDRKTITSSKMQAHSNHAMWDLCNSSKTDISRCSAGALPYMKVEPGCSDTYVNNGSSQIEYFIPKEEKINMVHVDNVPPNTVGEQWVNSMTPGEVFQSGMLPYVKIEPGCFRVHSNDSSDYRTFPNQTCVLECLPQSAVTTDTELHIKLKQDIKREPDINFTDHHKGVCSVDVKTETSPSEDGKIEMDSAASKSVELLHKLKCAAVKSELTQKNSSVVGNAYPGSNLHGSNSKQVDYHHRETLKELAMKSQRGIFQFIPPSCPLSLADTHILIEKSQCEELGELFVPRMVFCAYNPLEYAFETHYNFVQKFCNTKKKVLFLGMNPGPWGMSQNGVPFGETHFVKDWLKISGSVLKPEPEHPKRPVLGLECMRSEVSGSRFWGFFKSICQTPENFFANCYVYNLCPLAFMSPSGSNITPPQIERDIRNQINTICDKALLKMLVVLNISTIVGIGKYAYDRAKSVLSRAGVDGVRVAMISHPSPLNVSANKGWGGIVKSQLQSYQLLDVITNQVNEDTT